MKFSFLFLIFMILTSYGYSQELNKYFGQAHFDTDDTELISKTENKIRQEAGIWMVRIDPSNGNVLVYTTELPYWTEEEFLDLFGKNSDKIKCPFIGIVREDKIRPFPFKDCE